MYPTRSRADEDAGSPNSRIAAAVRPDDVHDHPQRRGLARPVGPEEAVHGPLRHVNAQPVHRPHRPERLAHILQLDRMHRWCLELAFNLSCLARAPPEEKSLPGGIAKACPEPAEWGLRPSLPPRRRGMVLRLAKSPSSRASPWRCHPDIEYLRVNSLIGRALGGTAKGSSNAVHRVGGPFDRGCPETENTVTQGLAVPPRVVDHQLSGREPQTAG